MTQDVYTLMPHNNSMQQLKALRAAADAER